MKEFKLPSGATLKIGMPPFSVSKALYQAVLKEAKGITIVSSTEMAALYKDLFCVGLSSPEIEKCLWECFKKCIYHDKRGALKIDEHTFEPLESREDYITVCIEVAKENILPFVKNLSSGFEQVMSMMQSDQK